jgi:Cu2+-exporting ATPase/Cu+-exporting ATPase
METCTHCDEIALPPIYHETDAAHAKPFCCHGCLTVHNILHQKGLESYYAIKNNSAVYKRRSPVELKVTRFDFLDDADFLREFSYADADGVRTMQFYLEGIHCLACLWLIEKLPEFVPGVYSAKLDLDRSVVTVQLKVKGKFSLVAKEFNQLGYRPHPLKRNQDVADLKTREERAFLVRIGIAGAAAGNIMIYAVSLYGGASGDYAQLFNALTVAFAVPVLTYSSFPFYQNAWNAIKNKTISIDIPISISLLVGAVMGVYNLVLGIPDNYFDSLTALVFLLLMSRYFLQKIQEKGLSASDLHLFYQSDGVLREENGTFREVHPRFIKPDDVLLIRPGEFVPADGVVLRGASNLNNSLLTGESLPVKVATGDRVFSGTQNLDQELVMKAENVSDDSRLGRLLKNVENGWAYRSKIVNLTNKVSKYFTLAVFLLAGILFAKLARTHDLTHALEGAITLLIVTCPCALALAVPLTFTRALAKAAEQGIIIKSDEVIEKLATVKHVFIDKTGTITLGKLAITNFRAFAPTAVPLSDVIYNLENHSRHPVAVALIESIKGRERNPLPVADFREALGTGVAGTIAGRFYEIKKNRIFEDGVPVATFDVADAIRPDSTEALAALVAKGLDVKILSGDRKEVVEQIAAQVALPTSHALSNLSPEEKSDLIKATPGAVMIGDGANDAIALGHAHVGVAVLGAMDISLRAADVYLTTPGLVPVEKLVVLSRETMKVIRRNLVLSLCYNSLSVLAAFLGFINPLVAAVIMPVSSLTVLLSTIAGTRKLRNLWK